MARHGEILTNAINTCCLAMTRQFMSIDVVPGPTSSLSISISAASIETGSKGSDSRGRASGSATAKTR